MVSMSQSSEIWMSVWNWGVRESRVGELHTSQGISDSLMCQDKIPEDIPRRKDLRLLVQTGQIRYSRVSTDSDSYRAELTSPVVLREATEL